jgi:hypothetical protein
MSDRIEHKNLFAALSAAQGELRGVEKSKQVKVTSKSGAGYKFAYAPLDDIIAACRPILAKHGLSVFQSVTAGSDHVGGNLWVETMVCHESGATMTGSFPVIARAGCTPQEANGSCTYARRYGWTFALGVASDEDDDGAHASGLESQTIEPPAPRVSDETLGKLLPLLQASGKKGAVLGFYKVQKPDELTERQATQAVERLLAQTQEPQA